MFLPSGAAPRGTRVAVVSPSAEGGGGTKRLPCSMPAPGRYGAGASAPGPPPPRTRRPRRLLCSGWGGARGRAGGGRRRRCAPRGVGARGAARGKGGAHGSPPRSRSTGWRRRRPGTLSQRWVCTCWVVGWAHSEPSQHTFSDHPTGPLGAPEHTLREPETNRFCFDRNGSRWEVPRHANLTVRIVAAVFGRRPSRSHPPMVVTGPAALSLPPSLSLPPPPSVYPQPLSPPLPRTPTLRLWSHNAAASAPPDCQCRQAAAAGAAAAARRS